MMRNIDRFALFVFITFISLAKCFDIVLDTYKQTRGWKFHGNFVYVNSSSSEEFKNLTSRLPVISSSSPQEEEAKERAGLWIMKHDPDPMGQNQWNMTNELRHLLFQQVWINFISHPSVAVVFKDRGDKELARFWSNGTAWCDAVFNLRLRNKFIMEVTAPKEGEYVVIDFAILGVMANITALKGRAVALNPCLTGPLSGDLTAPDMLEKAPTMRMMGTMAHSYENATMSATNPNVSTVVRGDRPTYAGRNIHAETKQSGVMEGNQTQTMDFRRQGRSQLAPTPRAGGPTTETYQTEKGGAKCDCVCTCAKPTSASMKMTNVTHPTTTINPLLQHTRN